MLITFCATIDLWIILHIERGKQQNEGDHISLCKDNRSQLTHPLGPEAECVGPDIVRWGNSRITLSNEEVDCSQCFAYNKLHYLQRGDHVFEWHAYFEGSQHVIGVHDGVDAGIEGGQTEGRSCAGWGQAPHRNDDTRMMVGLEKWDGLSLGNQDGRIEEFITCSSKR